MSHGHNLNQQRAVIEQAIKIRMLEVERGNGRMLQTDLVDFLNKTELHFVYMKNKDGSLLLDEHGDPVLDHVMALWKD